MEPIDHDALKQLLVRNWMTHDAMWFRHCAEQCGIETTNRVNRAAVRSMAAIEARRLLKAMGRSEVRTLDALRELVAFAWQTIRGDFMDFAFAWPAPDVMRVDVRSCFAYEGVKQLGAIDRYECGIFERMESWFDTLGVGWTVAPKVVGCAMHADGRCWREYTFSLPGG